MGKWMYRSTSALVGGERARNTHWVDPSAGVDDVEKIGNKESLDQSTTVLDRLVI
jgi:hypothetical protein